MDDKLKSKFEQEDYDPFEDEDLKADFFADDDESGEEEAEGATAEEGTAEESGEEAKEPATGTETDSDVMKKMSELEKRLSAAEEKSAVLEKKNKKLEEAARDLGYDVDTATDDAKPAGEEGDKKPAEIDYAAMAKSDIAELNRVYPQLGITSLVGIKNAARYGELRDKGLSPVEAFRATNSDMLTFDAAKQGASAAASKSHLQSVARKAGSAAGNTMTAADRRIFADFFGDELTEEEQEKLFKRVTA